MRFLLLCVSINAVAEKITVQCDLKKDSQFEAEVTVPSHFHTNPASKDDAKNGTRAYLVEDDQYVLTIDGLDYSTKTDDNLVSNLYADKVYTPTLSDYNKKGFAVFNGQKFSFRLYSNAGYPVQVAEVPIVDGKITTSGTLYYPAITGFKNPTICTFAPKQ
jgi:hypothetical protein